MNSSIAHLRSRYPVWVTAGVWSLAFLSPAAYFLLLALASKFQINLPEVISWPLLFLIAIVALLICESVVWSCSKTIAVRIGGMALTLLAMLLQIGVLLVILRAILVTRIGYVQ